MTEPLHKNLAYISKKKIQNHLYQSINLGQSEGNYGNITESAVDSSNFIDIWRIIRLSATKPLLTAAQAAILFHYS